MTPEERLAKIEGILEQMSKTMADRGTQEQQGQRLARVEAELGAFRSEMHADIGALRSETDSKTGTVRSEMHSKFRWTIGMIGASMLNMWIAIAVALLFR
jgi:hypothetical protein